MNIKQHLFDHFFSGTVQVTGLRPSNMFMQYNATIYSTMLSYFIKAGVTNPNTILKNK